MQLLVANNAVSTLALNIAPTDTSCFLQAGTGALFPNPFPGQYFAATLTSAANGLVREIVYILAISGDTVTSMLRGQEGTTPQAFLAGDYFRCQFTAGAALAFTQTELTSGDPNGLMPGVAASAFGSPTTLWDNINDFLWVCVSGGSAAAASWVPIPAGALGRLIVLTGTLDLFVAPPPFGSDTLNNGLSSATPFATISHALYIASTRYNINGFSVHINLAGGTYNDSTTFSGSLFGSTSLNPLLLNATGPVVINAVGGWIALLNGANVGIASSPGGSWTLNMSPGPAGALNSTIATSTGSTLTVGNGVSFGDLFVGGTHAFSSVGSTIQFVSSYNINFTSGDSHWLCHPTSQIVAAPGITVNSIGVPVFSNGFAHVYDCAAVNCANVLFSGPCIGPQYILDTNGVINTQGTLSGLPGSTAGVIVPGGGGVFR
jgi:hypothetical protein